MKKIISIICLTILMQSFANAVLYKRVNGDRVMLTQREETIERQRWAANLEADAEDKARREATESDSDKLARLYRIIKHMKGLGYNVGPDAVNLD